MATLNEIDQEKQKVSERLARLDAERAKLGAQRCCHADPIPHGRDAQRPESMSWKSPSVC
jgi:hypothetical protein